MTEPREAGPVKLNTQTLLVIVAWVVSAGIQYGIMKASQDDLKSANGILAERIVTVEKEIKDDVIGRHEYEARQQEIIDRLGRIENKLDRNQRQGGKVE